VALYLKGIFLKYFSIITMFISFYFLPSSFCLAGSQTGIITKLVVHDNGAGSEKFDVKLLGVDTDMPWCATTKEWTAFLGNEASKMQFSILLTAYTSGKPVTIQSDADKKCPDGGRNRIRNGLVN